MSVESLFNDRQIILEQLKNRTEEITALSGIISGHLKNGGKILIAGNGGSAATASHFASEIVGKFKRVRSGYPAISLNSDASISSALANDYGYDKAIAKALEALGNQNDIFIALSTSGNSKNLISGLKQANRQRIYTVSLLGGDGGKQKGLADLDIIINSYDCGLVQEAHLTLLHIIAELIENNLK